MPDHAVDSAGERKKRPAFQFYPGDWRKDVELRSCSVAARGLWIDLLCVMHECEPYGHLVLNGMPMTPAKMAGQIGVPAATIRKLLDELLENGVARTNAAGVIYSKRMVGDEAIREAKAEIGRQNGAKGAAFGSMGAAHGKKGGRPSAKNPGSEPGEKPPHQPPENPPPSSSTSTSEKDTGEQSSPPQRSSGEGRFPEFWSAWPSTDRKQDRKKCLAKWQRSRFDLIADVIVAHVTAMKATKKWLDGYEPAPLTYLNGERWSDGAPAAGVDAQASVFEGAR